MRLTAKKIRVLIFQPEADTRCGLEKNGEFEVKKVIELKDGLSTIDDFKPDVVMLSTFFPKLDGVRFLKVIKESTQVPVLMTSETQTAFERISSLNNGADDFLCFPISAEEIAARVIKRVAAIRPC